MEEKQRIKLDKANKLSKLKNGTDRIDGILIDFQFFF